MSKTVSKPLKFTSIAQQDYIKAAGGPSWVDTDCSAVVGTHVNAIWVVVPVPEAAVSVGIREHGSTGTPLIATATAVTYLSKCDASGHFDMYRHNLGNIHYNLVGYFE